MKIVLATYPYHQQKLKGGDHVLFDAVHAALKDDHRVLFADYGRPLAWLIRRLPGRVAQLAIWVLDLFLPIFYTIQILRNACRADVVIADSAVITSLGMLTGLFQGRHPPQIVPLINIDYTAYVAAVGARLPLRRRLELRIRAWWQRRSATRYPGVAVSTFVESTFSGKGLPLLATIENVVTGVSIEVEHSAAEGPVRLVYAGSNDYFGKGIDVLQDVASHGIEVHAYTPVPYPGLIHHSPLVRQELMSELPSYSLMLFPSRYESFGLIAVEAMALGVPVLMRKTGIGLVLEKYLPECIMGDDASPHDWVERCRFIVANRVRIAKEARRFSRRYLDADRFSTEWRALVKRLAVSDEEA